MFQETEEVRLETFHTYEYCLQVVEEFVKGWDEEGRANMLFRLHGEEPMHQTRVAR